MIVPEHLRHDNVILSVGLIFGLVLCGKMVLFTIRAPVNHLCLFLVIRVLIIPITSGNSLLSVWVLYFVAWIHGVI
jgi:hypothetical protein